MKWLTRKFTSRLNKNQAGQSIVLLAFAFIALVGFTGLVTDISILFVRFSTLRRTVDSAAIAAAGQIREGTDFEAVALSARQFIQLHGLEPHRVLVETCETDIAQWRAGQGAWEGTPHPESSYPSPSEMGNTELCNWEAPRKLVRVTAQIESETFFLRLLGINNLTLESSSVSETAVLDVALVLDTSESMAAATDIVDYTNAANDLNRRGASMTVGGGIPSNSIRPTCYAAGADSSKWRWGPCCNDPGTGKVYQDAGGNWIIYTDNDNSDDFSAGDALGVTNNTADFDYSDLVCNPFRQVKDAARNFVKRLDFVRGDRVALITFDRVGRIIPPQGEPEFTPNLMMTSEELALATLNKDVGVNNNLFSIIPADPRFGHGQCEKNLIANDDYNDDTIANNSTGVNLGTPPSRWLAYEAFAGCPDTNMGGGIKSGNDALTNAATIRRDAVWVMIVLSDGAATATNSNGADYPLYGHAGYCPWNTFCNFSNPSFPTYAQCPATTSGLSSPFCNDDDPDTRHFCLQWSTNPDLNGRPDATNPECGEAGLYDADDFARDWADFAGLIDVADGVPGNFIAIFTIGFGNEIANTETGAPLLRYIADAGDNGFIDNDLQQDWRDNHARDFSVNAADLGEAGPCEGIVSNTEWCGQYYYANSLSELDAVFEAIASRLFTRLSR